ncbi:polyphosphate kinase 2 [Ancylobacter sp. A5.8]|uniref:polyphosphate kinase 2 n=1 Tax=Ancylobacter gelatini TaxID=2919920 RepID=UPI001F4E2EC6|nr:polyphosphate kinase 2 [Ancylobacter gelatini]MCJ8143498.1 polyphosphate kinase 2 [Ancylobacter gelatini]
MTKKPGKSPSVPAGKAARKASASDRASASPQQGAAPVVPDDLAAALSAFSIDAPQLAPVIAARAYGSGHYPYVDRPKRKAYQKELRALQIELLKLQNWVTKTGERIAIVFEGRDGAGKGGTIHRVIQHLNPRYVRTVALSKPSDAEAAQWYFQRYVAHLPRGGEITLFDRSWYNRAVVEPVMGFCTPQQTAHFLEQVPVFEKMLADDGIRLFKIWLDIGREMQLKRLFDRRKDPLKHWKLSPVDLAAPARWDAISTARDVMLARTHTPTAPWTVVLANDKMRARLGVIRQLLSQLPYDERDDRVLGVTDPAIVLDGPGFLARRND